jgi:predicted transcriptional regulator
MMDTMKLYDSELKIMDTIWREDPISEKQISIVAGHENGWNKNTTYTVIKKRIDKHAISREEPRFICVALISQDEVQKG